MVYDFNAARPTYPAGILNPEIIESAYYLYHFTGHEKYHHKDYMPTFFFAETLKYFYLTFTLENGVFVLGDYLFNTEAHPFGKSNFDREKSRDYLGLN